MVRSVSWWICTALARADGSRPLLCPETWLPSALQEREGELVKETDGKGTRGKECERERERETEREMDSPAGIGRSGEEKPDSKAQEKEGKKNKRRQ